MANRKHETAGSLRKAGLLAFVAWLIDAGRERFCVALAGRIYVEPIAAAYAAVTKPAAGAAPAADGPSGETLQAHTDLGLAIWYGLAGLATNLECDAATRGAAVRTRDLFGGKPMSPHMRPEQRVERAAAVRSELPSREAEMALLTAAPGGAALVRWIHEWCAVAAGMAEGFVDAAVERKKAAPRAASEDTKGTKVRRLLGLVNRARVALRDEVAHDERLPRTLETEVYALYDRLLAAQPAPRKRDRKKTAAGAPKASNTPATPSPSDAPPAPPAPDAPAEPAGDSDPS